MAVRIANRPIARVAPNVIARTGVGMMAVRIANRPIARVAPNATRLVAAATAATPVDARTGVGTPMASRIAASPVARVAPNATRLVTADVLRRMAVQAVIPM